MPGHRVSRSELYDLVWSEPASKLAKRFGISDVMLAKVCQGSNIPKPGLGYWAKLESGRTVERTLLPARSLGQDEYIIFGTFSEWEASVLDGTEDFPRPHFNEGIEEVRARARALAEKAPIRKTLSNPHPEISKILSKDETLREKQANSGLGVHLYRAVSDSKQGLRLLIVVNALLKALDYCGLEKAKTRGDLTEWSVHIGSQVLAFNLASVGGQKLVITRDKEEVPLSLSISWWQAPDDLKLEWSDGEDGPLENQIRSIAEEFLVAAELRYRELETFQYERLARQRSDIEKAAQQRHDEAIEQEDRRLAKLTQERRQELFHDAAKWRKAEELRAYVNAALAVPSSSEEERENKACWGAWALDEADQIDPLKKKDLEDER